MSSTNVRPSASSSTFLSTGPFVWVPPLFILRMVRNILQSGLSRCLSLWWGFCYRDWFRKVFWFVWDTLFLLSFISSWMIKSASNIPKTLEISFTSDVLILSWFGCSLTSAICFYSTVHHVRGGSLSFSTIHHVLCKFFYAKFHPYILAEYFYYLHQSLQLFFIFYKELDVVYAHQVFIFFVWVCKFVTLSAHPKYVTFFLLLFLFLSLLLLFLFQY